MQSQGLICQEPVSPYVSVDERLDVSYPVPIPGLFYKLNDLAPVFCVFFGGAGEPLETLGD